MYFGGQYNHLITKVLKYMGVQVKILTTSEEEVSGLDGIVISGGPQSIVDGGIEHAVRLVRSFDGPILGICLGHQIINYAFGGGVRRAVNPEYGMTEVKIIDNDTILTGFPHIVNVWESHTDEVYQPPPDFKVLAISQESTIQAVANNKDSIFGVQFHPEVKHTQMGQLVFENFIKVCTR
ncbi:GMP synthase [Sulfolobales archaeon HS-7]|nr:GMP synthase [Sulfolobales archaeon HS-7]